MTDEPLDDYPSYHEEFPQHEGPPRLVTYTSSKIAKTTKPVYSLSLDAGAFRLLWELLEAEVKRRYPTRETMHTVQALIRAQHSMRDAYWAVNEKPEPPAPPAKPAKRGKAQAPAAATPPSAPGPSRSQAAPQPRRQIVLRRPS